MQSTTHRGFAVSLRNRRASALLKDTDVDVIYSEFALINDVLGPNSRDPLQPDRGLAIRKNNSCRVNCDG